MTVLFSAPEKKLERRQVSDGDSLHDLQRLVDGWIEIAPTVLPWPFRMVVNDEGLLRDLPVNPLASALYPGDTPICGNAVIMAEGIVNGEPDLVGLTDHQLDKLLSVFSRIFPDLAPEISPDSLERCDSCEYADDCQAAGSGCISP